MTNVNKYFNTMYFIHSMYKELIMIKKQEKLHQLLFIIKGLINSEISMKD